jgi:hypothetical protein
MNIILLVNDSPELTEQFIQLGEVFGYSQSDITIVKNIESVLENKQFDKMIQNYTATTIQSDLDSAIDSLSDDILILDDDYFIQYTGVTDYLNSELSGHTMIGLIVDSEIKILYFTKENYTSDYSSVYEPSNLNTYFANQKELNANRNYPTV